jgi:hypothetical protein
MSKEQKLLFSEEEDARQELVMSSPVRPVQKMFQAVPAAALLGSDRMPDFRYAEGNLLGGEFFSPRRRAPPERPEPAWRG